MVVLGRRAVDHTNALVWLMHLLREGAECVREVELAGGREHT
jgi:hypothetical protein